MSFKNKKALRTWLGSGISKCPHANCGIKSSSGEKPVIRTYSHRVKRAVVSQKWRHFFTTGFRVPDPHRCIFTGGYNQASVRTPDQLAYPVSMSAPSITNTTTAYLFESIKGSTPQTIVLLQTSREKIAFYLKPPRKDHHSHVQKRVHSVALFDTTQTIQITFL